MSKTEKNSLFNLPTLILPKDFILSKITSEEQYLNNKYSSYLRSRGERVYGWFAEEIKNPVFYSPRLHYNKKHLIKKTKFQENRINSDYEISNHNIKLNNHIKDDENNQILPLLNKGVVCRSNLNDKNTQFNGYGKILNVNNSLLKKNFRLVKKKSVNKVDINFFINKTDI